MQTHADTPSTGSLISPRVRVSLRAGAIACLLIAGGVSGLGGCAVVGTYPSYQGQLHSGDPNHTWFIRSVVTAGHHVIAASRPGAGYGGPVALELVPGVSRETAGEIEAAITRREMDATAERVLVVREDPDAEPIPGEAKAVFDIREVRLRAGEAEVDVLRPIPGGEGEAVKTGNDSLRQMVTVTMSRNANGIFSVTRTREWPVGAFGDL